MFTRRVALALASTVLLAAVGCSNGGNSNPTSPTPPATQASRTIELGGPLDFGDVQIGQSVERELRVHNRGTSTLTVTGFTGPSGFTATWTSGPIAPGGMQTSIIRFAPTESRSYSGTLTVSADHTAGTNTIAVSARGMTPPRPRFGRTGVGNSVFDLPKDAARLRIIGIENGSSSNFVVRIAGRLVVNELVGSHWNQPRYQGDHLVPTECRAATGTTCVVEITNSSGVQWSFEEL